MVENPLSQLINRELGSVEFVMDYLQLRFSGLNLTLISDPIIQIEGKSYSRDSQDFCNLLIGCIGKKVIMAMINVRDSIRLEFENGLLIYVSLRPEDQKTTEAAFFTSDTTKDWWAW